ncbi:phage integrase [Methylomonas koyamae]|uniref:phage integrase n=1 Tax=Methylomonas TaxID=416 RepID=UPI003B015AC5
MEIDADLFLVYRKERLAAGVSANTINHEQTYLNAIFNGWAAWATGWSLILSARSRGLKLTNSS